MAGIVKTNAVQLGDSATATQNFTLRTNIDGTATLARGNVGATTQDILTIAADGTVKLPASLTPAFSAYQSTLQSLPNITTTKIVFQTVEFDTTSAFNVALSRFQPTVAGYYQVQGTATSASSTTGLLARLYKNGVAHKEGTQLSGYTSLVSSLVYLNGTTDYLEIHGYQSGGSAQNTIPNSYTWFNGALVARA